MHPTWSWTTKIIAPVVLVACAIAHEAVAQGGEVRPPPPPPLQTQPQQQRQPPSGQPPSAPMMRQDTETSADQILDEGLLADPGRIAQARVKADEPPPQTGDHETLARFFHQRGMAAGTVGRQSQALRDLRAALNHAERSNSPEQAEILYQLAIAAAGFRHHVAAARLIQRAIEVNPPQRRARLIVFNARLTGFMALSGDLPGAERALAMATDLNGQVSRGGRVSKAQLTTTASQVTNARGQLAEAKGRYVEAEELIRKAIADGESQQLPAQLVEFRRLSLAENLRMQGRLGESENEARLALSHLQRAGGSSSMSVATGLGKLATILAEQNRYREAEALIRKAIEIIKAGGLGATGAIRSVLADVLAGQGRWQEAAKEIALVRETLGADPDEFAAFATRNSNVALIDLMTGNAAPAIALLTRQAEARQASLGDKHFATAEARGLLGVGLAMNGEPVKAMAEFAAAVPILTARSREADDQDGSATARDQRLRLVLEANMRLIADRGGPAAAAEAFRLAESARGRSVVRALAESAARASASSPALADLARREQDAQRQIGALNGLLANAISAKASEQDSNTLKALRERIDSLRDERARTMEEIERKFPDYANLVNPKPASIEDARKGLRPGEALIAIYSAEDRTYVWAVPHQGTPGFVAAKLGRDALEAAVTQLRKALDPQAESLDDIPAFDLAAAYKLYADLLKPTEPAWAQAKSLFVVPHGALGQISLGLLPTAPTTLPATKAEPFAQYRQVPWLIRKVAVVQLPSVSSLATLRSLPDGRADRKAFVGFADPWFSKEQAQEARQPTQVAMRGTKIKLRSAPKPAPDAEAELRLLPRLPETADEVKNIAIALKADLSRDLFVGAAANKGSLKQIDLSGYRVVMFATHGLVPGDLAGLAQPALALTGSEVSPEGGNGLLTMEEILSLKLDADWVVLSACNTASGQGAGAEAISGLGRAFFYAGTRALLVSNWPVETTSAQKLTTDLFARQAADPALSRGEALRQAMLGLIDGPGPADAAGKPIFSYAHPIFWAAFTLVGDGGGRR